MLSVLVEDTLSDNTFSEDTLTEEEITFEHQASTFNSFYQSKLQLYQDKPLLKKGMFSMKETTSSNSVASKKAIAMGDGTAKNDGRVCCYKRY